MTTPSAGPLLRITDLAISFAQPRPAVRSISLHVDRGEVLALVGESGSGKSMTARAVLGILPPGATASGSIVFDDTEIIGLDESGLNRLRGARIAMVFQEPQTALNPVRTIGWQLSEAIRAHTRASRTVARELAVDLLRQVEIPEPEQRLKSYPHQLSGGQKQRVVLALALAGAPDLLLADEPTTALDVTVQAEILELLHRITERTGASVVLITHNLGVVARLADRVAVLQAGEVVEEADTGTLFAHPQHPYTRQLLAAVPRLPAPPESSGTDEVWVVGQRAADHPALAPELPVAPILQYRDVRVEYGGRAKGRTLPAIDGVSLQVAPGEVVGLVGESGSGKTTLGRLAAGLVPLVGGEVVFDGDVRQAGRSRRRVGARQLRGLQRLAMVHQDPEASLDPRFTVGRAIREPLDIHRVGTSAERRAKVESLLESVRLPAEFADRLPRELSGGQRQRVALARALALEPQLLVADEPTSALDVSVQAEVLELFSDLQRELDFACIFISHDLAVVHEVADSVAVLRAGQIVEHGPVASVFGAAKHPYTRQLLAAVPAPDPNTGLAAQERARRAVPIAG